MNLIQIRTLFRKLSGRFDLVNSDMSDNGADFFINEGRKFLDRLDETQKSWANIYKSIKANHFYAAFPHCRAIKEVWAATTTERWQLEKKSLQDLMSGYLTLLPSSRTSGTPLYFSPCISRYIPEDGQAGDLEAFAGFIEVPAGNSLMYNAILLNVPTDKAMMVTITGLFYSIELSSDTDTNYWSEVHPMLLYMSAMRQIEIVNRNTQGVKDWTDAIATELSQLGKDLVEEVIAEVDEMEG